MYQFIHTSDYEHVAPGQGEAVPSSEHIQSRTIVAPIEHEHPSQPNHLLALLPHTSGTAMVGPEATEDLPPLVSSPRLFRTSCIGSKGD